MSPSRSGSTRAPAKIVKEPQAVPTLRGTSAGSARHCAPPPSEIPDQRNRH